ncbi:porin family protein [Aquimarina gracilis]|uniref:Porin family protein n=1 Tax=Aquimarina gracilis TaxID=874422 RepID=A0ABU6A275_9FLAO|nr:porin family protein [Aquimarina gracilis]MEB3348155.1 porin family protein [Aquimarina gracilis]
MNKKLFFIAFLMGLFCPKINAQVEDFEIGIKFGLNATHLEDKAVDSRTSIHLGLAAEFPINEYLGLQPELLYSFQGFSTGSIEPNFEEEILKIDYVILPVMLKYYPFYVVPGLSVEVGPQIGYLTSATLQRKNVFDGGVTETSDVDYGEFISDVDIAVNFGFGYQFPIGAFFQVRYNLGVTNIYETSPFGENTSISFENSVFQFSTGIKF